LVAYFVPSLTNSPLYEIISKKKLSAGEIKNHTMKFIFSNKMSRLRKKLLLYFLLVAIVSISVSAEIILEVSSAKLENEIKSSFYHQIEKITPQKNLAEIKKNLDTDAVFSPIYKLRNRMILFLLFVSVSIIAAFVLFTKDIISPMDGIVEATKKIVAGDFTVTVPVMSEDEIGLIARSINDIDSNLTNMINQVKHELNKYKFTLIDAHNDLSRIAPDTLNEKVLKEKKIRTIEYRNMIHEFKTVTGSLTVLIDSLSELQGFLSMYKTYTIKSELSQLEIDEAIKDFK
jgi:methyl-accepting chemotaxis protein